jgi:hypothetical protein
MECDGIHPIPFHHFFTFFIPPNLEGTQWNGAFNLIITLLSHFLFHHILFLNFQTYKSSSPPSDVSTSNQNMIVSNIELA